MTDPREPYRSSVPESLPTMPKLEVQLLGSPRIRAEGRELRFRTRKTLSLLAVLLSKPGAHRRETLATLLWGDLELDAARRELRKVLSYLKSALAEWGNGLEVTRETLELHCDELTSDAQQLTEAARQGTGCSEHRLQMALDAYRGEFMLGLEPIEPALLEWLLEQRETHRRALGLVAGALIELQIVNGQITQALCSAAQWVRLEPACEAAHRRLIQTHVRAGNHSAALEAFEACRNALASELEGTPGIETRRVVAQARAALGFGSGPQLIGRSEAWAVLERVAVDGGLCLICGEPGIGKTRLATEFAVSHGEAFVLWAGDLTRNVPLAAIAMALRSSLTDPARCARLNGLEAVWRNEISRLVPEFGCATQELVMPSKEGRARLMEGLLRGLAAAVGPQGVLVLDDLHEYDADSADLALALTRRLGGLTIACARKPELEANAPVTVALEGFERHATVTRVILEPLSLHEVAQLVGGNGEAAELHRVSGGNPLYALEAAGHGDLLEGQRGVLELLRCRVKRLGEPVQRLLEAASLCGECFDADSAQRAAGLTESEAVTAFEVATNDRLIGDWGVEQRFSHGLIRQALIAGMSAQRQRRLHRRFARESAEPGLIAQHLELGGSPREAIAYRLQAAAEAMQLHAYSLAITHQDWALRDGLDDEGFANIFEPRYRLFMALADWANLEQQLINFEITASRLGKPKLIALVEMGWIDFYFRVGRYALCIDRATRLLHQALPNHIQAMTRYTRGVSLLSLGRHREAECDCTHALSFSDDHWPMRGWVLNTLAICLSARREFAEALAANELSDRWFRMRGDRHGMASVQRVTAPILAAHGHLEHALDLLKRTLTTAHEIAQRVLERAALETVVSILLGHFEDAANTGVARSLDEFFRGADRDAVQRALPWIERCLESAQQPQDAFLEPLWMARVQRAHWLVSHEANPTSDYRSRSIRSSDDLLQTVTRS